MIKAKLLWTQTCIWLGNIFWIIKIKYELCCDRLTINLSTSTVNFQTFPTIYSSCEKKCVCHHHKCKLELLKNLDVFHVCEIRSRVRPEWSEGVEGWQDHLWAVGEDPQSPQFNENLLCCQRTQRQVKGQMWTHYESNPEISWINKPLSYHILWCLS